MAKRLIRKSGDEILRKKSKTVNKITGSIITLLEDMKETMNEADGVGLAAVQVGVLRRIAVVDIGEGFIEMINPKIISEDGEQVSNEACLSVPGYAAHVDRPLKVEVQYFDRNMNEKTISAEGYLAVVLCHEIDHLDGVLFTDKSYELPEDEEEDDAENNVLD